MKRLYCTCSLIMVIGGISLLASCDQLPFFGKKKGKGGASSAEEINGTGHLAGQKTPDSDSVSKAAKESSDVSISESKQSESGQSKANDKADGYILYTSSQPIPVGTVMLTTVKETNKSKTSFLGAEVTPDEVNESTTEKLRVYGRVIDSEKQITLHVKTDQITKSDDSGTSEKSNAPLHGTVAKLIKDGDEWKATLVDSRESSQELVAQQMAGLRTLISETYNQPDDFVLYGTTPRKEGDTWEIDASKLPSFQKPGYHVQPDSFCTVRFKELKEHAGHIYAVLETSIDVHVIVTDSADAAVVDSASPGTVVIRAKGANLAYRSLKYGLNLSEQVELSVETRRNVPASNGYNVLKSRGTISENTITELELQLPGDDAAKK